MESSVFRYAPSFVVIAGEVIYETMDGQNHHLVYFTGYANKLNMHGPNRTGRSKYHLVHNTVCNKPGYGL